jgi:hypothetical protein
MVIAITNTNDGVIFSLRAIYVVRRVHVNSAPAALRKAASRELQPPLRLSESWMMQGADHVNLDHIC